MYMKICFYGAASKEIKSQYTEEAYKLGEELVKRGHELVFGGGENGMMGAVTHLKIIVLVSYIPKLWMKGKTFF